MLDNKIVLPLTDALVKHIRASGCAADIYPLRLTKGEPIPGISKTVENYTFELASSMGTGEVADVIVRYRHPGESKVFEELIPVERLELVLNPNITELHRIGVLSFLRYSQLRDVMELSSLLDITETLGRIVFIEIPELEARYHHMCVKNEQVQEILDAMEESIDRLSTVYNDD